jgi:hypothetical protein
MTNVPTKGENVLRAALLRLLESHKDLARTCAECVYPDSLPGDFVWQRQEAYKALLQAERAIKMTAPKL